MTTDSTKFMQQLHQCQHGTQLAYRTSRITSN